MAGKGRVLIVGLDSMSGMLLSNYLVGLGYEVERAADAVEVLGLCERWTPDVVIERCTSPEEDVVEALRSAAIEDPVVALDADTIVRSEAARFAATIPWPAPRPALAEVVASVLSDHRAAKLSILPSMGERDTMPAPPAGGGGEPAATIGRYTILSILGRGGMGDVYRCLDESTGRVVAVKTIRCPVDVEESSADPALERFRVEAAALSRLVHPRIVAISHFGVDRDRGEMYLVMQYVDGPCLRHRLDQRETIALREALQIGWDIADALAHAHERGVVHRDVKPENVLINDLGQPMLTDFGLARLGDYSVSDGQAIAGTPNYMAPEQILDPRHIDARTDQYGLGAMLHEILAGPEHQVGDARPGTILSRLSVRRPSLLELGVVIPEALDRLLSRMLEPEPAQRFAADDDLLEALAAIGRDLGLVFERY